MGRTSLVNDFSWSKSRHDRLAECLRSYYFQYYGSWGGWESDAPAEARELYLLKKLGNRYAWVGTIVHDFIKDALLAWRAGRPVDPAQVEARARKLMQDDYRYSKSKGFKRGQRYRKAFAGLMEHEYDDPVSEEAWRQSWETARSALAWFFSSRWPALAQGLAPEQWLEVDAGASFSSFTLQGVKVFAIPDFAYVEADGTPVVVDWKTGRAREGYDEQVVGYALYLSERYRLPLDRVKASLVYLNDGVEQQVQVSPEAVQSFKSTFVRSVARMRELLEDPERNLPREPAAFPPTEDMSLCARCVYRRPCGREQAVRQAAESQEAN